MQAEHSSEQAVPASERTSECTEDSPDSLSPHTQPPSSPQPQPQALQTPDTGAAECWKPTVFKRNKHLAFIFSCLIQTGLFQLILSYFVEFYYILLIYLVVGIAHVTVHTCHVSQCTWWKLNNLWEWFFLFTHCVGPRGSNPGHPGWLQASLPAESS